MMRHSSPAPRLTLKALSMLAAAIIGILLGPEAHAGSVLDKIKSQGAIRCGAVARPGLLEISATGTASGMFLDLCRAIGSAVLGPQARVVVTAYESDRSFDAVREGMDDVYFLSASEIIEQKLAGRILPGPAVFYETTAVMVPEMSSIRKLEDLASRTICFSQGANAHRHLEAWSETHRLSFQRLGFQEEDEMRDAYNAGECFGLAGEQTSLAAAALNLGVRGTHNRILAEPLAAFPILAASSTRDAEWAAIVTWTIATLMRADAPASNWAAGGLDSIRLDLSELGLDKSWQKRAVDIAGSYREIFSRNLGDKSRYCLPIGLNASWPQGGLMLPPYVE
jgi:general L-amino acid transport system substrate-binding protein